MFARAYFPGRTGQLLVVPKKGDFITRPDPYVTQMHGSPWPYDVDIPLMFTGPAVKVGRYSMAAAQQDIAPTLVAALGVKMPPTATGHVLPVLRKGFGRPRVIMLLVLDGMRRDYFDRHAASMPALTALRRRSAWFTQAQVNVLPSNTAVGHSTFESENCQIYIDQDRLSKLGLTLHDLAQFLESQPYMFVVFTNDEVAREAGMAKPPTSTAQGRDGRRSR